ncbi:MAG: hypothetical protein M3356_00945, partial [Actinomycetota bacterium]|nr:hypothetical protein [Actinomycetota bacterium]
VVASPQRALQAPGHDARVQPLPPRWEGEDREVAEREDGQAAGGDFRAVAPPAMSFAQGRR